MTKTETTFFVTTVRDCKADEGLFQHPVRRNKNDDMGEINSYSNQRQFSKDPRQGIAKGLLR